MGLNEVKLGAPVPYPAHIILRDLVGTGNAREIMEEGEFYGAEQSLGMGMVDEILPAEELLEKAIEKAAAMGSHPRRAFEMIKQNRTEGVEARILARRQEKESSFVECWYQDEVRVLLEEAMKKF